MAKRIIGRPAVLEYENQNGETLGKFTLICRDLSAEVLLRKLSKEDRDLFTAITKAQEINATKDSLLKQLESATNKDQLNKQIKSIEKEEAKVVRDFEKCGGTASAVLLSEKMFDMIVIGGEKEAAKEFIREYDDFDSALEMIREDLAGN